MSLIIEEKDLQKFILVGDRIFSYSDDYSRWRFVPVVTDWNFISLFPS